jgi:hypothetical protein
VGVRVFMAATNALWLQLMARVHELFLELRPSLAATKALFKDDNIGLSPHGNAKRVNARNWMELNYDSVLMPYLDRRR